jgi:hypothetical protein
MSPAQAGCIEGLRANTDQRGTPSIATESQSSKEFFRQGGESPSAWTEKSLQTKCSLLGSAV